MLNFFSKTLKNIFGTWKNFYNVNLVGTKGPAWIDVEKPSEIYNTVPQINSVINRKAKLFSNMEIMIMKDGERVQEAQLEKLLQNPNTYSGLNDWLEEFKIQEQVYGNQYMYFNKPSSLSKYPISIQNISAKYVTPILTGKLFEQVSIDGIIEYYQYQDMQGNMRRFETNEILQTTIKNIDNPILGVSPIMSLRFPVTNTKLAYEYFNVISGERGMIGILKNKSQSQMGAVPLTPEERERIEREFVSTYGVGDGQKRIKVTEADLEWQAMSYPTKDLLLQEQIDANFMTIVDHFGLNINMFSNKNATFENVKNSIIQTYQDTIIPEADRFVQKLSKKLNLQNGLYLEPSYKHVSILMSDKNKEAETLSKNVGSVVSLAKDGIITNEMALNLFSKITEIEIPVGAEKEIANKLGRLSPLIANSVIDGLTTNEIRNIIGLPPVVGGDIVNSNSSTSAAQI